VKLTALSLQTTLISPCRCEKHSGKLDIFAFSEVQQRSLRVEINFYPLACTTFARLLLSLRWTSKIYGTRFEKY